MKLRSIFLAAALASASAGAANASVVQFTGSPSTSWADGTFTTGLSGHYPDGLYKIGGLTSAANGYGQNGESILFTTPKLLEFLSLGKCNNCYNTNAVSFTVSLYNSVNTLLTSQTIAASPTLSLLTFNTNNVSKTTITFIGGDTSLYNDGRLTTWYNIKDVTYGDAVAAAVPEPAAWMLMIGGFGLVGAASRRRRVALAA